jgi:transposase
MPARQFSRDFKTSAVQLVQEQGYSIVEAAKSLGVHGATLRYWVRKFGTKSINGTAAPTGEAAVNAEIRKLREEVRRLRIEREILKKATAFFANQQP